MDGNVFVNGRFQYRPITGVERFAGEISKRLFDPGQVIGPGKSLPGIAGHCWEQVTLPQRLPRQSLLWSPANTGPIRVRNQAITIHDLAPLDYPEWYRPAFRLWYRLILPRLAQNSRFVITVSQFSKDRIVERLSIAPDRIAVVPGGVDRTIFYPRDQNRIEAIRRRLGLASDYLLSVGTIQPRKNLVSLIRAWELVRKDYPDISLVIAGETQNRVFQEPEFEKSSERVCWAGYLSDPDLAALYSGARALILPSFYEGFGLCLLEAMACGAPVLTSTAGALPEIVQSAGLYFSPYSWEEMAESILILFGDPALGEELVRKGQRRVQSYSWEMSARILNGYLRTIN